MSNYQTKILEFDIIIFGISIAGIAAALKLASHGYKCGMIPLLAAAPDSYDTDLVDFFVITPTPLNKEIIRSTCFWAIAIDELNKKGITILTAISMDHLEFNKNTLRFMASGRFQGSPFILKFITAIYSPNGSLDFSVPDEFVFSNSINESISFHAPSDSPFFKGEKVIVFGNGTRVFEESLFLSEQAQEVIVVYSDKLIKSTDGLKNLIQHRKNIKIILGAKIQSIYFDKDTQINTVNIFQFNKQFSIKVKRVFLANELKENWLLWNNKESVFPLIYQKKIIPCGFVNGIHYLDHAKLFEDGTLAAEKILKNQGT